MDLLAGNDGVQNVEIYAKKDRLDYAATDSLHQQPLEVVTVQIMDGGMSNVESSAMDSTVTNNGVVNSAKAKNLDDAAMVTDRTDIAQVTIVQTDNNKYWECDICQKIFFYKSHFVRHKLIHFERKYTCEVCEKNFRTQDSLRIHMRIHTGEKPFMCGLCEKTFSTRERCSNHQRTHIGVKLYTYKICDKTGKLICKKLDNSYQCSICHEKFSTTAGVNRHRKRLHFNKSDERMFVSDTFPCGICGEKFADLEYHMLVVHPDGKLETCATCNMVFPTKKLLKTHMRVHEQGKFKCDICGGVYHKRNQLTKHKQRHTRKKMPCVQCGTFFIQQHPPQPWEIIKCRKCKSKTMTKYCADCKVHTNLNRNHCCRTYQRRKLRKHNLQLKRCGEIIKTGKSTLKKFAVDLKDLSVISKISCDVCKQNFQSGRFHAIGLHCCGTLKEIGNMFENFSNSATSRESTGNVPKQTETCQTTDGSSQNKGMLEPWMRAVEKKEGSVTIGKESYEDNANATKNCESALSDGSHVDDIIPPPPAFGSNNQCQKIVEIREKGNTEDFNSTSEHLGSFHDDEIMEEDHDAIMVPMTAEVVQSPSTSKWEKSIMQEIFHIKQEIVDS